MTRGSSKQPVVCSVLPGIAHSLPPRAHHILHAPHPTHTTLRAALPICPPFHTPDAPSATALPPIDRPQEDSPSANGMCCVCSAALHPTHIMESAMSGVKMTHAIELAPSAARGRSRVLPPPTVLLAVDDEPKDIYDSLPLPPLPPRTPPPHAPDADGTCCA